MTDACIDTVGACVRADGTPVGIGPGNILDLGICDSTPPSGQGGCRASAARVALAGLPVVEPSVANPPEARCETDAHVVLPVDLVVPIGAGGLLSVHALSAQTSRTTASADASVADARLVLPGLDLAFTAIRAHASATRSSSIGRVTLNGTPYVAGDQPRVLILPGGVTLAFNADSIDSNGVQRRQAVVLTGSFGEIVLGEAAARHLTAT
jgi:hypothetical protein